LLKEHTFLGFSGTRKGRKLFRNAAAFRAASAAYRKPYQCRQLLGRVSNSFMIERYPCD